MPILTKPSVSKGTPASFSIDKAQLAAHSVVAADSHFSNSSNWSKIVVRYKNTQGQNETVIFDASQSTPTSSFSVSTNARGDFEVQSIDIFDEDGGKLRIKRSDLTASEWDVGLVPVGPVLIGEFFANITTQNANVTNKSVYPISSPYNLMQVAVNIAASFSPPKTITGMKLEVMSSDGSTVLATSEVKNVTRTSVTAANSESNWETFSFASPVVINSPDVVIRFSAEDNEGLAILCDTAGGSNRFFNPNNAARLYGTAAV